MGWITRLRKMRQMKTVDSQFFIKNFLVFLIPLVVPLLILGLMSIFMTKGVVENEINNNNMNLLKLTEENLELIFNEMDSLNLNFGTNPEITVKLKNLLNKSQALTFEEYNLLATIKSFIDAPANARPFIQSIYVYFKNPQNRFVTTTDGLVDIDHFYDASWLKSYTRQNGRSLIWTEARTIRRYSFETRNTKVLTIYRLLNPSGGRNSGVIVLNIYTEYLARLLKNLETLPSQEIAIVDESNQIIFKNKRMNDISDSQLTRMVSQGNRGIVVYPSRRNPLIISYLGSERYHWKYISVVPQRTLYQVPTKLRQLTLLLLVFSFILGLALTYWLTRKNYHRLQNIISIIDSAEKGNPLPPLPVQTHDEYDFITHNLLKTFIEQSYLKLQLSERKYKLRAMELLALQSQLNPHFLFNTLETLKWKIIQLTQKPNETSQMLENLSDILKYSLDAPRRLVTLAEEIKNTRSYVEIQKIRYRDKFDLFWEYDEPVLECSVIRMLFQPLIENSIYHGIKAKAGKSHIKIKIQQRQSRLKIVLIDDGIGMQPAKLAEIRNSLTHDSSESEHIGLLNTQKRLQLTFGEDITFQIRSKPNLGTVITLRIPSITDAC